MSRAAQRRHRRRWYGRRQCCVCACATRASRVASRSSATRTSCRTSGRRMSKGYLRGEEPIDKAHVRPAADYEAQRDRAADRTARDGAGSCRPSRPHDRGRASHTTSLILATGARAAPARRARRRPRRHPLPAQRRRTPTAARRSRHRPSDIVVVGGGWIGSEVACFASPARPAGHVPDQRRPAPRARPGPASRRGLPRRPHRPRRPLRDGQARAPGGQRARRMGRDDRTAGARGGSGRRWHRRRAARRRWREAAGLRLITAGIEVDDHLRTSAPGIFAIGDVASAGTRATADRCASSTGTTPTPGQGRGGDHRRSGRRLRPRSVPVLGSVRRWHGVPRPRARPGTRSSSAAILTGASFTRSGSRTAESRRP